jgi:hypothetical protein
MIDLTLCKAEKCEVKLKCARHQLLSIQKIIPIWQAIGDFSEGSIVKKRRDCPYFLPRIDK